jgi:hypothetical protein
MNLKIPEWKYKWLLNFLNYKIENKKMKLLTALAIALAFFGHGMECSVALSSDPASSHPLLRQTGGPVGPVAFNGVAGGSGVASKFDQSQFDPSQVPQPRAARNPQYDPTKFGQGKWNQTKFDPSTFASSKSGQSKFPPTGFKRTPVPAVQGAV